MFKVLKFGGSSVADATAISRVMDILAGAAADGKVILVCSAISGCTDALLGIADGDLSLAAPLEKRHLAIVKRLFTGAERARAEDLVHSLFQQMEAAPADEKVTFGEIFSTRIIALKLEAEGYRARWLDSRRLVVSDDMEETFRRIRGAVSDDVDVHVAPGFIASTSAGKITTLGRGGSDYSAAIYAAAVSAGSLQIWTDVPGFMTANPKDVPAARTIPMMSYNAALDLASHGAKVLYAPTVAPAMESGIAIEILDTFRPRAGGTVISGGSSSNTGGWIGITSAPDGEDVALYLVGDGKDASGGRRLCEALRRAGIAPLSVTAEDGGNVLAKVRRSVSTHALEAVHREFFESAPAAAIDLYIAGFGAVGKALVDMIGRTAKSVSGRSGKTLRIVGIGTSGKVVIDPEGIAPGDAAGAVAATPAGGNFVDAVLSLAGPGSVFVDCTSSEDIHLGYESLLEKGISIVSSNRRSLSVPYVEYAAMHAAAHRSGVFLRYETTVGAALPVLESISRGTNACDEVLSIEAVVSCTLNQILGDYTEGDRSFANLLRKAQLSGLTEKDPRADLGGKDALRKLLILAREAGVPLEEADVEISSLVPPGAEKGSIEDFYTALEKAEPEISRLFRPAGGLRPRFVASLEKDASAAIGYRASIRVKNVDETHPAYFLRGTENAIIVRSSFHPYPLVIQGAGEGATQAASSILNDILR